MDTPDAISLRPATPADADYCQALYFIGNAEFIRTLKLSAARQVVSFHQDWKVDEVRIIQRAGADVGWLQTRTMGEDLFLAQLFLEPIHQGAGIGTAVLRQLIQTAAGAGHAVTLGVIESNPALRLYRRLGFVVTHHDEYKLFMRLGPMRLPGG